MTRSPWPVVTVTVVLMVAVTLSTYLPWQRIAPNVAATTRVAANVAWSAIGERTAHVRVWLDEQRFIWVATHGPLAPPSPRAVTAIAAGVAALAVLAVVRVRTRRRRPRVLEMARRGVSAADIARETGLSQDAVRLLLSPHAGVARSARTDTRRPAATPPARIAARGAAAAYATGSAFREPPASFAAALRRATGDMDASH